MTTRTDNVITPAPLMQVLQRVSQAESQGVITTYNRDNKSKEISLYTGDVAKPQEILVGINRLKAGFPKMSNEFFNLLAERLVANGFTPTRLKDAVDNVLDNFSYKELNISDVIRYDKRIKIYTYNEVCSFVTRGEGTFKDFERKYSTADTTYWVRKSDVA